MIKKLLIELLKNTTNDFPKRDSKLYFRSFNESKLKIKNNFNAGFIRESDISRFFEHLMHLIMILRQTFYYLKYLKGFSYLHRRLHNKESKELLIKILLYRIAGETKIKLPVDTLSYWEKIKTINSQSSKSNDISSGLSNLCLNKYCEKTIGLPLHIYSIPIGVMSDFILNQYQYYDPKGMHVSISKGDYVIDGGACWGDTSLLFAVNVGKKGKVYAFEFDKDNLKIFNKNCSMNRNFANTVRIIKKALWNTTGEKLTYSVKGPGTSLLSKHKDNSDRFAETITLDKFVQDNKIERIDFVKLDIEGAELQALKGGVKMLKKFHPKLAIALYHKPEDFGSIPAFLDSLNLGYQYFLKHVTPSIHETMLFANPSKKNRPIINH